MKANKTTFFLFISQIALLTILIGSSIGFSSCFKFYLDYPPEENDSIPEYYSPWLNIKQPQSNSFDVGKGENIPFVIETYSNYNSNADIKEIRFNAICTSAKGNVDTIWYPDSSETKLMKRELIYMVPIEFVEGDLITIKVSVYDVDSMITTREFVLTVKDLSGIIEYDSINIGAQFNDSFGSFYSCNLNKVFNTDKAQSTGQNEIDLIYCYHSSYKASIVSPDNDDVFGNAVNQISELKVTEWTTRRKTKFRHLETLSDVEWRYLTGVKIAQLFATSSYPILNIANNLAYNPSSGIGTYSLFKTEGNVYGIIKVNNISSYDSSGFINIDLKIKK